MIIFGIIVAVLAVLLSVAGFLTITIGLWKSFIRDSFNRAIYLGLALISTAAIIFSLSGPIVAGGFLYNILDSLGDDTVASEQYSPAEEDVVEDDSSVPAEDFGEGDSDLEDPSSLGGYDLVGLTEESAALTNGNYFTECIESEKAGDFFYSTTGLDGIMVAYLVPISPDAVYVVSDTNDGPAIFYVNSYEYVVASGNEAAYEYSYLPSPEEFGLDPIDTSSEEYVVAEGCVS